MVTSVKIKNFRCFENFSVENLTPITIIGGKNNSGKTALLESFVVPLAITFRSVFWYLLKIRNIGTNILTPMQLLKPLFYNMSDTDEFSICLVSDNVKSINFTASKSYDDIVETDSKRVFSQESSKNFSSLNMKIYNGVYTAEGTYQLPSQFSPDSKDWKFQFKSSSGYHSDPLPYGAVTFCRNVNITKTSVAESISKMNLEKSKRDLLVTTIKHFDPNIIDINVILDNGEPYIYVTLNSGKYLPISYMGDGINRALEIIVDILKLPNGILLIDEVENGFHYSLYETLMKVFCETALSVNCQVIMTSHNRDFIEATLRAMEQLGRLDDLSYQRLGFYKGQRKAFLFSGDSLYSAFESNMEMR